MKHLFLIVLLIPCMGSRLFVRATPDFLQTDTATFTAGPATICAWFRSNDVTNRQQMYFNGDKDTPNDSWCFRAAGNVGGDPVEFRASAGGSSGIAVTTTAYSINVWHHSCARQVSITDRSSFIDGGSKGDSTTSVTPPNADRTAIGRAGDSTPSNDFNGDIAHVSVWDVALSDAEIATLAQGVSPRKVRSDNLIAYWPINGQSPEIDIIGGINLTINGTPTVSEEPPPFFAPIVAP